LYEKIDGATDQNLRPAPPPDHSEKSKGWQKKPRNGRKNQKRQKQTTASLAKKSYGSYLAIQGDVIILFSGSIAPY
jgi:hypothetical protein